MFGLAATAVSGCEAGTAPTSTSRDSLGVTIVESVVPAWAPDAGWRIAEEPIVDLAETGSGDRHDFFRVQDMLRAGEHLIVADGVSQELRVYDSAGRFLRAFGGRGEGPGEFRFLRTVVSTGDGRLVAMDGRMGGSGAEFDIESGLMSTFRMPQRVQPLRHPVPSDVIWGWDGGYTMDDEGLRQGLQRAVATVVRLSDEPDVRSSGGKFSGARTCRGADCGRDPAHGSEYPGGTCGGRDDRDRHRGRAGLRYDRRPHRGGSTDRENHRHFTGRVERGGRPRVADSPWPQSEAAHSRSAGKPPRARREACLPAHDRRPRG